MTAAEHDWTLAEILDDILAKFKEIDAARNPQREKQGFDHHQPRDSNGTFTTKTFNYCPTCGAKWNIRSKAEMIECPYCGSNFRIQVVKPKE